MSERDVNRPQPHGSVLDSLAARLVAVVVALAAAGALGYLHHHRLFPHAPPTAAQQQDDPFDQCFGPRAAEIETMLTEGTIKPDQATLFRGRAEAMCRAQAAKTQGGAPGLPPGMRPPARF
jgi:hypothetical protein